MIPSEFHPDLWRQKTRVPGLSRDVVYVILHTQGRAALYRASTASRGNLDVEKSYPRGFTLLPDCLRGPSFAWTVSSELLGFYFLFFPFIFRFGAVR